MPRKLYPTTEKPPWTRFEDQRLREIALDTSCLVRLLQNYPGPGESYEPSMSVLEGRRSGALPSKP